MESWRYGRQVPHPSQGATTPCSMRSSSGTPAAPLRPVCRSWGLPGARC
jgi:hypothetical protein